MPTLSVHLSVASEASASVGSDIFADNMGDLLLGSTAPDIRRFIGVSREETHFVSLTDMTGRCGIGQFLQDHPCITDFSTMSGASKAFVAGYLSHLITDRTWISEIYRPYFGIGSSLEGLPESNILDRALQFELDQRERQQLEHPETISEMISQAEGFVSLGLFDNDALRRWRTFIGQSLTIEDASERFRLYASNLSSRGQLLSSNRNEGFAVTLPALIARALQHVPESSINNFRQKSIDASIEALMGYITGDFESLMDW